MIHVQGLCKSFKRYNRPVDKLVELVARQPRHVLVKVLHDVSFDVAPGECVGIIGPNGGGKSTLLKILIGVLLPNAGTVGVNGRITGLLELGTGFNPEMTGIENIYLNGMLLGLTRKEIDLRREAILDFTELGDAVHAPLRTYSSGMVMRLAFSTAFHAEPNCFVIDEALAVGDARFQRKCFQKIQQFRDQGGAILFVSHDMNMVKRLCNWAMLLHDSRIQDAGEPERVVNTYNYLLAKVHDQASTLVKGQHGTSHGNFQARIIKVSALGRYSGSPVIRSNEEAIIRVVARAERDLDDVTCGITIRDQYGQDVFGTNTWYHNLRIPMRQGGTYLVAFHLDMCLGPGRYSVSPALHTGNDHTACCYHWVDNGADFEVAGWVGEHFVGTCNLRPTIEVSELEAEP